MDRWHVINETDVYSSLKTSKNGLSQKESDKRIEEYGLNKLPDGKKRTLLQIIIHQIINPLIFILLVAAAVSIAIGEPKDAIFILLVIVINSALGAYQEYNAEKYASNFGIVRARKRRS